MKPPAPKHNPAFIFDLDGVIVRPQDTVLDAIAAKHMYTLLESGAYVAVNTGRSYEWVESNLLGALQKMAGEGLKDKTAENDIFDRLFIVCEKGGESSQRTRGHFVPQPSRFALVPTLYETVRHIYEENKAQLPTMLWDKTKLTMATIEKYPEADLRTFGEERKLLLSKLQAALKGQEAKIDPTISATDVEHPQAGKHAGAELIYAWVASHKGAAHNNFICFGDSRSDYEMARYFAEQGAHATFVFVGDGNTGFDEHEDVTLIRTGSDYTEGTREYFKL